MIDLDTHLPKRGRGTALFPVAHAPVHAATLWAETIQAIWPWRDRQYQGYGPEASKALGLKLNTVYRWLYKGANRISPESADKIAALCLSRGTALLQLAEEWRRYSEDRTADIKANRKNPPACPPGGFLTSKKR